MQRKTKKGREIHLIDRTIKIDGEQHLVEMQISSSDNLSTSTFQAWTVQNMAARTGVVDWSERRKDFPHLKVVNFPKLPENPKIQILFGLNYTRLFASTKTITNEDCIDDPIAIRTFLGWTCIGRSSATKTMTKRQDPTNYFTNVIFPPLSPSKRED